MKLRRLKILAAMDLLRLTEARLLAYRKKALSIENCVEDSEYSPNEVSKLDPTFIWFKSDPRWKIMYDQILHALTQVQHHDGHR